MNSARTINTDDRRSWPGWLAWGLFLILVAYPLSTGPTIWLVEEVLPHTGLTDMLGRGLEIFYMPLGWLVEVCEPAETFFMWYLTVVWGIEIYIPNY